MEDQIVIRTSPIEKQYVYIFSSNEELSPICKESTLEELLSVVAMSAAKYNIKKIKLSGAKDFALGIKEQLTKKICTCFGKVDDFTIELL